jgi:hypothetical protein
MPRTSPGHVDPGPDGADHLQRAGDHQHAEEGQQAKQPNGIASGSNRSRFMARASAAPLGEVYSDPAIGQRGRCRWPTF